VRHAATAQAGVVAILLSVAANPTLADNRESRRIQPVFEKLTVEKPVIAAPARAKTDVIVRPQIESLLVEKPVYDRLIPEKSVWERPQYESPDTVDVFRRLGDSKRFQGLPRRNLAATARHPLPGYGKNPDAYRLGPQERIREHCRPYDIYHFRNSRERKPDRER